MVQSRNREVHRALMLKYRGTHLIKAGFIGAVLATLVVQSG